MPPKKNFHTFFFNDYTVKIKNVLKIVLIICVAHLAYKLLGRIINDNLPVVSLYERVDEWRYFCEDSILFADKVLKTSEADIQDGKLYQKALCAVSEYKSEMYKKHVGNKLNCAWATENSSGTASTVPIPKTEVFGPTLTAEGIEDTNPIENPNEYKQLVNNLLLPALRHIEKNPNVSLKLSKWIENDQNAFGFTFEDQIFKQLSEYGTFNQSSLIDASIQLKRLMLKREPNLRNIQGLETLLDASHLDGSIEEARRIERVYKTLKMFSKNEARINFYFQSDTLKELENVLARNEEKYAREWANLNEFLATFQIHFLVIIVICIVHWFTPKRVYAFFQNPKIPIPKPIFTLNK